MPAGNDCIDMMLTILLACVYDIVTSMTRSSDNKKHVKCAGCVVYRLTPRPQILLIKPREEVDAWGICKGHLEPNESLIDCAIRETWEESGLACMPDYPLTPVETVNPKEHKRVHAFLARCMGDPTPDPIMKHEVADIRWWPIEDLPRVHRYQIPLIKQACDMLMTMSRR